MADISVKLSKSLEDYLESILFLQEDHNSVRMIDISTFLDVKKPSVTKAIKKLEERGLVIHENYSIVSLTKIGLSKAKEVKNKHCTILKFLTEILGVDKKEAEIDACKLEHSISNNTFTKLSKFLDFIDQSASFDKNIWNKCFSNFNKTGKIGSDVRVH